MYCWRPHGAHAQILLQMCTQMLPNWFPQSKVTRNQCTIFHFIFQRLYKAGKREAYWMDLHWCPGMLWCPSEQPGCRVLCGCPAADKPSLCSARSPMCLFCSILEKWVLKQKKKPKAMAWRKLHKLRVTSGSVWTVIFPEQNSLQKVRLLADPLPREHSSSTSTSLQVSHISSNPQAEVSTCMKLKAGKIPKSFVDRDYINTCKELTAGINLP